MAIHIGHRRGGWRGLVTAGICFILPAMLFVVVCAWTYRKFGPLPQAQSIMYGVKPVIIAVILQAVSRLARSAVKNSFLVVLGLLATVGALVGGNVLAILLTAGSVAIVQAWLRRRRVPANLAAFPTAKSLFAFGVPLAGALPIGPGGLFLVLLKFGAVVFGSGHVLLAFLQADLVTPAELADPDPTARRGRRWPGNPGPGIYDCYLHRLSARRCSGRGGSHCWHFPSGLSLRRRQPAINPANPRLENRGGIS
jgi:chromate transport protein ChrA